MSDKQWRPPLAPKPASISLHPPQNAQSRGISPALRGAVSAFSHSVKPEDASRTQTAQSGATLAAAAVGKRKPALSDADQRSDVRRRISPVRGRSQLTLDLDRAARTLQASALNSSAIASPPPLNRTTSELAARVASSRTSPARSSESSASRPVSPQRRLQRLLSRDAAAQVSLNVGQEPDKNAVRGAAKSMSAHPVLPQKSPHLNSLPQPDLHRFPSVPYTRSISPEPSKLSTTGAALQQGHSALLTRSDERNAQPQANVVLSDASDHSPSSPQKTLSAAPSMPIGQSQPKVERHDELHSEPDGFTKISVGTTNPPKQSLPVPIPPPPRKSSPRAAGPGHSPYGGMLSPSPMTADSLANAMVASSLASSRAQSPAPASKRSRAPPIPHRRSQSLHERRRMLAPDQRPLKPMPIRPMRQTLRNHSGKDDDEEEDTRRGRKHILRKHPNKHHEGDRKRWRDKVTEGERKRYEGLWAANRGVLSDYESSDLVRHRAKGTVAQDLVINVVVRDVWERSRLPNDVLEEIWDLVTDSEESLALNREEFVVGLWLIDQRLKGRKLPVKVGASVWGSVRWTSGVKVRNKPL